MKIRAEKNRFIDWAGTAVLIVSGLCLSLFLAWLILSAGNFFYPLLHDVTGVQDAVERNSTKNIYKRSFDETTRKQRAELFSQIVYGINHDGEGLEAIRYSSADGKPLGLLLRAPEITHLRDVANLLNTFRKTATIAGAVFFVVAMLFYCKRLNIRKPRYLLAGTVIVTLAALLIISLAGTKEVFYQWHTLVFPQGHQWFFYYDESLMTLLMKAPDLFAWIAAILLILALVMFYLLLVLTHKLLKTRSKIPAFT